LKLTTMKKLIVKNIIFNSEPITEDERIWIESAVEDFDNSNEDKLLIDQIYQMGKTYSNSEFTVEDLFMKALEVYMIQSPTKVTFKNPEKWKEQFLLRVRMKILEIITP